MKPTALPRNTWTPLLGATAGSPNRAPAAMPFVTSVVRRDVPVRSGFVRRPASVTQAPQPETPRLSAGDQGPDDYGLTEVETDVLRLLADGASNAEIAKARGSAVGTVKVHLARIYRKLRVTNRTQAVLVAERLDPVRKVRLQGTDGAPFRIEWLLPHATCEIHVGGQTLFRAGDPADALFYLQSGRVTLPELGVSMDGGTVFGEIGVFSAGRLRTATVVCETPVRIFRLEAGRARDLHVENPMFAFYLMQLASQRLAERRSALM